MHRRRGSRSKVYSELVSEPHNNNYEYSSLVKELRRISQPRRHTVGRRATTRIQPDSPESLKHELLRIHRRNENTVKRRKPKPRRQKRQRRRTSVVGDSSINNDDQIFQHDYVKIAKEYQGTSKFRVPSMITPCVCVICLLNLSTHVIFPCEHLCFCYSCLECSYPKQCPVCQSPVHIVLKHTGGDSTSDTYWKWVDAAKSPLTEAFIEKFRRNSNDAINAAVVQLVDQQHEENVLRLRKRKRWSCWRWTRLFLCRRVSSNQTDI